MLSEEETQETLKRLKNHPAILESLRRNTRHQREGVKGIEKADDPEFAHILEVKRPRKKIYRGLGKTSGRRERG